MQLSLEGKSEKNNARHTINPELGEDGKPSAPKFPDAEAGQISLKDSRNASRHNRSGSAGRKSDQSETEETEYPTAGLISSTCSSLRPQKQTN